MLIEGRHYRSIWRETGDRPIEIIDQTCLPYDFVVRALPDLDAVCEAIRVMRVRGAPLIGATAAHGLALALEGDPSDAGLARAGEQLAATRPTAVNLRWAIDRVTAVVRTLAVEARAAGAREEAERICDEDVAACEAIGTHGLERIREIAMRKTGEPVQLLTHCNAGWLATVDWGTALAPIYKAHAEGLPIHVWVDETRPRNQGASLTAFELREMGIPHTVVVDNAGGHLMQRGQVDAVIVGSDRTTASGDVCNKIGTYLKALAAHDTGVPFYVALPFSTVDWEIQDGVADIPIEERDGEEVRTISGHAAGDVLTVEIFDRASPAANPAFDVTPARYVTSLITERGVCAADRDALAKLRDA